MDKLFFECGWTGDGFMQLQRETRAVTPLMHEDGYRMVDGSITLDVPQTSPRSAAGTSARSITANSTLFPNRKNGESP